MDQRLLDGVDRCRHLPQVQQSRPGPPPVMQRESVSVPELAPALGFNTSSVSCDGNTPLGWRQLITAATFNRFQSIQPQLDHRSADAS